MYKSLLMMGLAGTFVLASTAESEGGLFKRSRRTCQPVYYYPSGCQGAPQGTPRSGVPGDHKAPKPDAPEILPDPPDAEGKLPGDNFLDELDKLLEDAERKSAEQDPLDE